MLGINKKIMSFLIFILSILTDIMSVKLFHLVSSWVTGTGTLQVFAKRVHFKVKLSFLFSLH